MSSVAFADARLRDDLRTSVTMVPRWDGREGLVTEVSPLLPTSMLGISLELSYEPELPYNEYMSQSRLPSLMGTWWPGCFMDTLLLEADLRRARHIQLVCRRPSCDSSMIAFSATERDSTTLPEVLEVLDLTTRVRTPCTRPWATPPCRDGGHIHGGAGIPFRGTWPCTSRPIV